jgi:integrase
VEADEKASSFLKQKRIAFHIVNDFVDWLKKSTEFKAKTIRTYAGAAQALVKYLIKDTKISTRHAGLPKPCEARKQYPWTIETVSIFAESMNDPLYLCLVALFFQSGIRSSDVMVLTLEDGRGLETVKAPQGTKKSLR